MAPTKVAPASLPDGEVLFGTGDRVVKLNFYSHTLYSAAFYGDFEKAKVLLKDYTDLSRDELVGDVEFHEALVSAQFKKVLRLTLCRKMPKEKIVSSFEDSLVARLEGDDVEKAKEFVAKFAPDTGFVDDDVLQFNFLADGKTVKVEYTKAKEEEPEEIAVSESAAIWKAFLGVYFDSSTELLVMKQGFISGLAALFSPPAAADKESDNSSECPQPLRKRRTWKERAGRTDGDDSYRFGDLTKTMYHKLVGRSTDKTKPEGEEYPESYWQSKHEETQASLATVNYRLANAERTASLFLNVGAIVGIILCLLLSVLLPKDVATKAQGGCLAFFVLLSAVAATRKPKAIAAAKKDD